MTRSSRRAARDAPAGGSASNPEPMLLWVGHMVPVKGLDVLIAACAKAAARADFHLYLVGDGPLIQHASDAGRTRLDLTAA